MKKITTFFAISIFVLSLSSCYEDDEKMGASITTFNAAMLMGSNEVPANNSTATGSATLKFNNTTKVFTVTVTHSLASLTGGHIHKGAAGTNGGVVFPFTTLISPINYTSVALTAEQEADLMANLYYINLHTAAFVGGEIRGQLVKGTTTSGSTGGGY